MKKGIFLYILLCVVFLFANANDCKHTKAQNQEVVLKDTVGDFVFDAIIENLDTVPMRNASMVKYFKYIGSDTVKIERAFTNDPHFICEYPRNIILKKNFVYPFTICFWFQSGKGYFHKNMGFTFSNGQRVEFLFNGYVSPLKTEMPPRLREK